MKLTKFSFFVFLTIFLIPFSIAVISHPAGQIIMPGGGTLAEAVPQGEVICTDTNGACLKCDTPGACTQVCIGSVCQSSWPSGGDPSTWASYAASTNVNINDLEIRNIRALQMKDWDDDTGGADNKYRMLARDGSWMFYNGGVVIGSHSDGTWGDVADGMLFVKTNLSIGSTTSNARLDVAGRAIASDWCDRSYDVCANPRNDAWLHIRNKADDAYKGLAASSLYIDVSGTYIDEAGANGEMKIKDGLEVTGDLYVGGGDIGAWRNIASQEDADMPRIIIDSTSTGDNWWDQGAFISIGEKASEPHDRDENMHMTYRGDGYGYIGSGKLSAGVPQSTYLRFDYNADEIYTPDNLNVGSLQITDSDHQIFKDTSGRMVFESADADGYYWYGTVDNIIMRLSDANGLYPTVTQSGSASICRTGSPGYFAICSSLRKHKKDIQDLQASIGTIEKLRPVTFTWKQDGKKDLGFIAEEVYEADPLLIEYNENGEMEGVKYKQLTAVLTKAIQEQQDQIEQLQSELCKKDSSYKFCNQ